MTSIYSAQNFYYSGTTQTYVIPPNVYQIQVSLYGANGGASVDGTGATGGNGGYITATCNVQPSDLVYIFIGGVGATTATAGSPGGFNGGGPGVYLQGGGGGGASDIRLGSVDINDRILVAGGGGGGTIFGVSGVGGGFTGGSATAFPNYGIVPATGGTQTAGGTSFGIFGQGGYGTGDGYIGGAGGGGGGYFGGGGGYAGSPGGGGSSYYNNLYCFNAITTSNVGGDSSGNGYAVIVPIANPSSQPTSHPTSVPTLTYRPTYHPSQHPTYPSTQSTNSQNSGTSNDDLLVSTTTKFEFFVIIIAIYATLAAYLVYTLRSFMETVFLGNNENEIVKIGVIQIMISLPFSFFSALSSIGSVAEEGGEGFILAIITRLMVMLCSVYLLVRVLYYDVTWKNQLILSFFHNTSVWIVVCTFIFVDPSAIRLLPFRKTAFSERCLGFPNLVMFQQASLMNIFGSLANIVVICLRLSSKQRNSSSISISSLVIACLSCIHAVLTFIFRYIAEVNETHADTEVDNKMQNNGVDNVAVVGYSQSDENEDEENAEKRSIQLSITENPLVSSVKNIEE